jgi:hypothetical protein
VWPLSQPVALNDAVADVSLNGSSGLVGELVAIGINSSEIDRTACRPYEVIDTKLARETKGATVLQLSLYSDLLSAAQGRVPEHMYVVTPGSGFEPEIYRTAAFSAYYRRVNKESRAVLGRRFQRGYLSGTQRALQSLRVADSVRRASSG